MTGNQVQIYVTGNSFSGDREEVAAGANQRVHLDVQYGEKQAQIELPVGPALFEREPGTEVFRRDLQELIGALEKAVASPNSILWGPHRS